MARNALSWAEGCNPVGVEHGAEPPPLAVTAGASCFAKATKDREPDEDVQEQSLFYFNLSVRIDLFGPALPYDKVRLQWPREHSELIKPLFHAAPVCKGIAPCSLNKAIKFDTVADRDHSNVIGTLDLDGGRAIGPTTGQTRSLLKGKGGGGGRPGQANGGVAEELGVE